MPTEQYIQKQIINYLETLPRCWVVKVSVANKKGTPDLIALVDGTMYGFEVKTPVGRVEPIQAYQLERITQAGGYGHVVRSVEDVKKILAQV